MKRIAIVGLPNTGKSTFFNRLTGASAKVGNWPGITVELYAARVILGAEAVEVVDLPGIYNLHGFSEDEKVARRFLETTPLHLVAVIVNATQLDRQLALPLQAKELGIPMVLLINMQDEARRLGIDIDREQLEEELGVPVVLMSAKHGRGLDEARALLTEALRATRETRANADVFARDDAISARLDELVSRTVHAPRNLSDGLTDRMDEVLLHPWLGLPLFFLSMLLVFEAVYTLGAPLQEGIVWVLEHAKEMYLQDALAHWPAHWQSFALDGVFEGAGTVLSFVPIIVLFFVFMGILEDSGYLSRAAFLMDAFMSRLGLDGRAFVIQLMGFGCNVPALMGTRVMRSRGLRLLTMLMIPFSLCSARLQVFVFLTTAIFSPQVAPLVLFSLYVTSFGAGFLTALLYRRGLRSNEALLLELPPYRFPTLRQMVSRGWQETTHFLREAGALIMLGVVLVWFLTHFPFDAAPASPETLAGRIAAAFAPIFQPIGIDSLLTVALLFGFVAKEVVLGALAVIYGVGENGLASVMAERITAIQAYSFMLFVLIYTPCLSTVAVLKQESRSWSFTALAVAWPLVLAWVVSFVFYRTATWLAG
jgi:ferrous iron transport protein B